MRSVEIMPSSLKQIWLRFEPLTAGAGFCYLAAVKTITYAIVLFLLAAVCSAHDDTRDLTELSIDELMNVPVYGASKFQQKMKEAPSLVDIITADEIKKYGYRTLADILGSLSSFIITNDRNYTYAGGRGFGIPGDYNTRILVLVDEHRINDNLYGSASLGNDFILDVDSIERVEIIRGPGYTLYGNDAFFAVINVVTRKGKNVRALEASGEAGSFDTYKGRVTYGNTFENGFEMLLSGSYFTSEGQDRLYFKEFDDPSTNNGIADHCDQEHEYNLLSTLSYRGLTLQGAYVSRTKAVPTASFETDFNDSRNSTVDDRGYIDLRYDSSFSKEVGLTARVYYDNYKTTGDYIYSGVVDKDMGEVESWGGELRGSVSFFKKHKILAGVEYQDNVRQNQKTYDEDPYFLYLDDSRTSQQWALYAQDEFKILKNLILNLGVRYDYFSTFGSTTNPRLALIYSPFESTTFKFIYGTAFRAPNAYELYYSDGGYSQKSNPDLKPEDITTYELIWEQYIENHLVLKVSGFHSKITDLISLVTDPSDELFVFSNREEITSQGAEFELKAIWDNGIEGFISYTYQDTRDKETDKTLVNSPHHRATFNLIVPLVHEKLFAGLQVQYTDKRKTLAGNSTDDFFVTNVTLFSRKLFEGLELSASFYNLFNQKFGDPGSSEHRQDIIEQDGRSFRLKMTFAF
jgi:outer membrane receptor for ferrienterochelin and colicins